MTISKIFTLYIEMPKITDHHISGTTESTERVAMQFGTQGHRRSRIGFDKISHVRGSDP